ncbi:MAG: acetolactate synthase small subunit [Anaerolineae bacterium]|jgi:acetolactate synthase-1/3 small subunit|nr:acetolactate synthase small subunit [Anaerolineae bacterium]
MPNSQETTKHTIVALVENKPGVLNRVVSMFRRRNFNLDSLTVGRTHKPYMSRMTISVDAKRADARQVVANLFKLINVIDVKLISAEPHVSRDLALVKVRTDDTDSFNTVTQICERTPARLIDIGTKVAIVEICAPEDVVENVIEQLRPIGIMEMVRTGVVAMGRGVRILDSEYEPIVPIGSNGHNNEHRYSV